MLTSHQAITDLWCLSSYYSSLHLEHYASKWAWGASEGVENSNWITALTILKQICKITKDVTSLFWTRRIGNILIGFYHLDLLGNPFVGSISSIGRAVSKHLQQNRFEARQSALLLFIWVWWWNQLNAGFRNRNAGTACVSKSLILNINVQKKVTALPKLAFASYCIYQAGDNWCSG